MTNSFQFHLFSKIPVRSLVTILIFYSKNPVLVIQKVRLPGRTFNWSLSICIFENSCLRGLSLQVLTLSARARFIIWRLRWPFLEECKQDPKYFWKCRACVGYGPAPGPTLKRHCAALTGLVGYSLNTPRWSNNPFSCQSGTEKRRPVLNCDINWFISPA